MRKKIINLNFVALLLLILSLSSEAEAGFFSTINHILANLTSRSKKIRTMERGDDSATEPIEPRDIGKPPTTGNCAGKMSTASGTIDLNTIKKIALGSKCATYPWKARDEAPHGYIEGMAIVYTRATCNPNKIASNTNLGKATKDALAYYGQKGSNRNTYVLLIGLGMRESSGEYCTGQDGDALENRTAEKAEAGPFQSSYDAIRSAPEPARTELNLLFKEYKEKKKECFLETFSKKVTCTNKDDAVIWGEGEGAIFQKLSKDCPLFAAEFAAINIRVNKGHYGTLNKTKKGEFKAEFRPECADMLSEIEKVVQSNPEICNKF